MSIVANYDARWRWELVLHGPETLGDDLGLVGTWVGPRTGPDKRTHGQKEDYVLRRLLVAWREQGGLEWPMTVAAETTTEREPDFLITRLDGRTLGVEVTEAGEELYQAWLTHVDREADTKSAKAASVPLDASTARTIEKIADAIRDKNAKFDTGWYQVPDACDLVVHDNTAWGGFLDKPAIVAGLRARNDLPGRFRQVHLVFESMAFLDLFGACNRVNLRNLYEIDYAGWVFDQVERLRHEQLARIDWANIAEELGDLGKSERRALASHLRGVLMHLLKWQFQPERRSESWRLTIRNGRLEASEILMENPSFKANLGDVARRQYGLARELAVRETMLPAETFPEEPPYELEQILDPDFWPSGDAIGGKTKAK